MESRLELKIDYEELKNVLLFLLFALLQRKVAGGEGKTLLGSDGDPIDAPPQPFIGPPSLRRRHRRRVAIGGSILLGLRECFTQIRERRLCKSLTNPKRFVERISRWGGSRFFRAELLPQFAFLHPLVYPTQPNT